MKKLSILITLSVLIFNSCSKSGDDTGGGGNTLDCSTVTAKTYADVKPIIETKCAITSNCHAAGSTSGVGPLLDYSSVFNERAKIRAAVASGLMPQEGTISTAQKNSILCWIDSGAPDN